MQGETRFIQYRSTTRNWWNGFPTKRAHDLGQFFASIDQVFPTKVGKRSGKVKPKPSKQRLLIHNQREQRVRLAIREIPFACDASSEKHGPNTPARQKRARVWPQLS